MILRTFLAVTWMTLMRKAEAHWTETSQSSLPHMNSHRSFPLHHFRTPNRRQRISAGRLHFQAPPRDLSMSGKAGLERERGRGGGEAGCPGPQPLSPDIGDAARSYREVLTAPPRQVGGRLQNLFPNAPSPALSVTSPVSTSLLSGQPPEPLGISQGPGPGGRGCALGSHLLRYLASSPCMAAAAAAAAWGGGGA